jgi:probable HAF family extracellular repeat protein
MRSRTWMWTAAVYLLASLPVTINLAAQDNPSQDNRHRHPTYRLVDMGTLGGQQSDIATAYAQIINRQGAFIGYGDTATGDPAFPDFSACFSGDCLIGHGFVWQNGVVTDLGALSPTEQSFATWINNSGQISGASANGLVDPLLGGREIRAVLWQNGTILNLGTLGGNESLAGAINDDGQVFGMAANTVLDQYSIFGWGTQTRAFLWQNGVMSDIGTLGGPDAIAGPVNNHGQLTGCSYTNDIPNPTTGVPTMDPFLWRNGTMRDLGTLGGTSGCGNFMNNRG